ncbi:MAG TPA: prolyl oligopeptidase family serine peptidase [Egibacteraceae bacterium]|nr:prolyl oligopeptidase family serine peptidase [Actinomycetota bacterium]HWB72750.1 prolyl oligopeptidase family serine peptidase [Egibacteraceae bacterium]
MSDPEPRWIRRFRAARVTLPAWAAEASHRVAYATNASGLWQAVSWDLRTGRRVTLTDKPTGVLGGLPAPDGTGVVWFDDHAGDEVGRYVVSPFDGGTPRTLAPDVAEGWSAGLSLRPGRLAVGVSDRDGSRIHVGDGAGTHAVYAHHHPAGVGGLSKDATLLAVTHAEHGDTLHPALRMVDAVTGEPVAELWDGEGNTVAPAGWSRVRGDQRLAILADRSGRLRPEIWTPATGQRVPLELDLPGEVWVADWWPDASALLLAHDHLGRTQLHRYDLGAARTERLDLTLGGGMGRPDHGTIGAARVRDDGAIWYAFTSSSHAPEIRVRRPVDGSGPLDEALLVPPGEPAPEGVAYGSLHYDNGEGGRVHAFLARPRGKGPFPLVVAAHGGPQAQVTDSFDPRVQAWVDHGFAVLLPNYRGSTGYGKRWEDALQGDPGRPELVDLRAGRDHLVAAGVADPDRVVLAGGSWGGYLALQGIGTQPESWSVAIAVVPVADYMAAYADESPVLQAFDRSLFGGSPNRLPALYRERSPLTHVNRVVAPVLIITGQNDTRCPRRQVDNYVAALAERGVVHRYDVFDAGHGSLAVDEIIRQQALAIDFAAEHLGTPPAQR